MKLHIAFDMTDLESSLAIAHQVQDSADILEVGSLMMFHNGMQAVTAFKKAFPQKTIIADMKIADRATEAIALGSDAGADWITVLAGTRRSIIHAACSAAHARGKKIMLDLIDASSLGQSALEAQSLGVDALLLHVSIEETNGMTFQDAWDMVSGNSRLPIFLTGTFTLSTLESVLSLDPTALIVGREITAAAAPGEQARLFKLRLSQRQ